MTQTPAQKIYALPEPVQARLCALVDAIAGMDALEKFCAHTQITQTARGLLATGDQMSGTPRPTQRPTTAAPGAPGW